MLQLARLHRPPARPIAYQAANWLDSPFSSLLIIDQWCAGRGHELERETKRNKSETTGFGSGRDDDLGGGLARVKLVAAIVPLSLSSSSPVLPKLRHLARVERRGCTISN